METTALSIVLVFGVIVVVLSSLGIAAPERLVGLVKSVWLKKSGMPLAVGVRLALGVMLIFAASHSGYPRTFAILGWLAIIAAVTILIAGRKRVDRLLQWGINQPLNLMRAWCAIGVAFGAFLIYGST